MNMQTIATSNQPGQVSLEAGVVDVWFFNSETSQVPRDGLLSSEEEQRAVRFHFERDRNRFTRFRSWLRTVVGRYLSLDPAHVEFEYGKHGKPYLVRHQNVHDLRFNLSHSGESALLAVVMAREVGVDIEQIDRLRDHIQIAERHFSARESAELKALPRGLQRTGFAACWTRKEAFINAIGTGLAYPLSHFSVTVHPHQVARITELPAGLPHRNWRLQDLRAPRGYRAACMVEGEPCSVRYCPSGIEPWYYLGLS
jgi:4'-phosphopantetheinyl transferase